MVGLNVMFNFPSTIGMEVKMWNSLGNPTESEVERERATQLLYCWLDPTESRWRSLHPTSLAILLRSPKAPLWKHRREVLGLVIPGVPLACQDGVYHTTGQLCIVYPWKRAHDGRFSIRSSWILGILTSWPLHTTRVRSVSTEEMPRALEAECTITISYSVRNIWVRKINPNKLGNAFRSGGFSRLVSPWKEARLTTPRIAWNYPTMGILSSSIGF